MNALNPAHMTASERLDEIGSLLAAGLIRLHARKSSELSRDRGDCLLDCAAHQSGHAAVLRLLNEASRGSGLS